MKRVGAVCTKGDRKGVYLNFLLAYPMTWDQSVWGEVELVPEKPATAGSSEKRY